MVNSLIIKNIWDKIYFHPLFYIIVIISLLTARFTNLLYFTIIILIHELGHSITGILLGLKLNKIIIYPYGGCSILEHDINIPLYKELLVLILGPITQTLFTIIIYLMNIDIKDYFFYYSKLILLFNLIPIYPLDGGKLIHILFSYLISFYKSIKYTIFISYFIYISLIFIIFFLKINNLIIYLVVLTLGLDLYKEIKKSNLIYNKFLIERYLNIYNFKKHKIINSIYKMKRDYYHHVFINNKLIPESIYLKKTFTFY